MVVIEDDSVWHFWNELSFWWWMLQRLNAFKNIWRVSFDIQVFFEIRAFRQPLIYFNGTLLFLLVVHDFFWVSIKLLFIAIILKLSVVKCTDYFFFLCNLRLLNPFYRFLFMFWILCHELCPLAYFLHSFLVPIKCSMCFN